MTSKPGTWGYKPSRARRAVTKLRGHKVSCKDCGKTFRDEHQRKAHNTRKHEKGRAKRRGRYGNCCGQSFHSDAQQKEHMLRHQEKDNRAREREQERARRTRAANAHSQRNGRPPAPPETRSRMQEKARRTLQASGRLNPNGQRIPYEPHPKLRPRTPRQPVVK